MEPIVINLLNERIWGKERYLFLDLRLHMKGIESIEYIRVIPKTEYKLETYVLHPKIRETAILYLSSLTFKDVKTFVKSRQVNEQLTKILDHYMLQQIEEIEIRQIVVTSDRSGVNDFLEIYYSKTRDQK